MPDSRQLLTAPLRLEVVTDTAAGLRAAVENGADRIELVAGLSEGGLTPSLGLMKLAAELGCPVRAMIRPRAGDFTYAPDELHIMHHDIVAAAACGLEGVVFGANTDTGGLDTAALRTLVMHAKAHGLAVALHRGFDLAPDQVEALDTAIELGFDTVLTSGGGNTAAESVDELAALVRQAAGQIEILAGKGVTAGNAAAILASGVRSLHASCSRNLPHKHDRAFELGYVSAHMRDTDGDAVASLRAVMTAEVAR